MILKLPFDQYQRYKIVQDAIDSLRDKDSLKILDVGGYPCPILQFLPNDDVLVVDQVEDNKASYQKADALSLPFEDGTFDFVTSVDVFEHIKPYDRERFLSELSRTAKKAVFLAAPFHSSEIVVAEKTLDWHYNECLKVSNQALTEHLENGLPDKEQAVNFFRNQGLAVAVFPNGYLERWLPMMMMQGSLISSQRNRAFLEQIDQYYNRHIYKYDNCEPCYRYLVIAVKDASIAEKLPVLKERLLTTIHDQGEVLRGAIELYNLELLSIISSQSSAIQQQEQDIQVKQYRINELERKVSDLEFHINRLKRTPVYKIYKFIKNMIVRVSTKQH